MKINIAVSSNNKFVQKTYPIVIGSLIEGGIDSKDIYIFNGYDLDDNKQNILNNYYGVNFFNLDYSCFEINSMLGILDNKLDNCDYWFMLHDTCTVGPRFKECIYNFDYGDAPTVRIFKYGTANLGAYRYQHLYNNRDSIYWFKNNFLNFTVKRMKWEVVMKEDFLHTPQYHYGGDSYRATLEPFLGSIRRCEYFEHLDLKKYKANYVGVSDPEGMIVDDLME